MPPPLSENREGGDGMENVLQALSLFVSFATMVYTILTYNHTKKEITALLPSKSGDGYFYIAGGR